MSSAATGAGSGESKRKRMGGTVWIMLAIVLALALAMTAPHVAASLSLGGEIFLGLLKMLVVPLVVSSVMSGVLGLGDIRRIGRPGGYAVTYYLTTTVLAVITGLVVVNLIAPGKNFDAKKLEEAAEGSEKALAAREKAEERKAVKQELADARKAVSGAEQELTAAKKSAVDEDPTAEVKAAEESLIKANGRFKRAQAAAEKLGDEEDIGYILKNLVKMLFTENLFKSAADMDLLPLILFSLVFAGLLTTLGERVDNVTRLIDQINHALMAFVLLIMKLAPLGIFCMVASRFGEAQAKNELWTMIQQMSRYMLTVVIGLAFHFLITLPAILWVVTRRNPYVFMWQMSEAILMAFSTASSSATLPVTMECAVDKGGVSRQSTEFVLPLGATVNMDGTALYEAAAAIFIAQAMGAAFDLTFSKQIVIAVTATLAAIGAAGIPEAGLFTMLIVLNAVDLPVHYIGIILPVDWLLDRFRTAVNVFGDAVGSATVDKSFRQSGEEARIAEVAAKKME